jgi:hypothetical protein
MSVNFNSNYTRIMKTGAIYTDSVTDGFATLSGGYLSNLYDPINDNDCATKYYVDNYIDPTDVSLPLNSIQINTGTNFIGVSALKFINSPVPTLFVYNKINNGSLQITDNNISGISNPIEDSGLCTYDYFTGATIKIVNYNTTNQSNSLTGTQIINTFLNRTITNSNNIIQDILPTDISVFNSYNNNSTSASTSSTFSFVFIYNFIGPAEKVLLFGNIIPYGNFLYTNKALPVITIPKNTLVFLNATYQDGVVTYYIKNNQNFYSNAKINNIGLSTFNFTSYANDLNIKLNATFMIWPMIPTEINSNISHTYTYSNIKNKLIIRTGLTSDTTDTFSTLSIFTSSGAFSLGSGQIKFVVQNISSYNIKIGPDVAPTGWSYDTNFNRTVPPNMNGFFYINYTGTTLYLYTIGIYNRNG